MFEKLLVDVSRGLKKKRIPYMIIGGQAVLLYGEPRLTKDIDITLGAGVGALADVVEITADLGYTILVDRPEDFVRKTMVFPVKDEKSGIRIDFIFSFSSYERKAIERAVAVRIGSAKVKYATLEDVIVHKIISGRPRDMEDVVSIILKNPGFDRRYIEQWLRDFDLSLEEDYLKRFREVLAEL